MAGKRDSYHHGDLRAALIAAGEEVLADTGVEGFSLRQVARKVGVSHSAPAHHFGDAGGLLRAMAADGFRRFLAAMRRRQAEAGDDPREMFLGSGLGYVEFAEGAPALFRLMFGSDRIKDVPDAAFEEAAQAAFQHLVDDVARLRGISPYEDETAMADVMAAWSMVHGFADLLLAGRMKAVQAMAGPARERFFRQVLLRVMT
ncbi:TetR/AcrR family transcriptional regulator [Roseovarius sp.]|uniref:TetR/AcrR family transcriptional regulator n=1 Tax=Roseovarius sp. TaxID=1486281 RepID=UPI002625D139|nr:TetR/AcrR family transcriptional regulator [Roseovarius sp.]MDM8166141.1 TetR/AcrR family transcriptional regulator [Roseovarius sp.]